MDSFDSNVVIYLLGPDPGKVAKSKSLLANPGVVSVQVFNEVVAVLRSGKQPNPTRWATVDNVLAFLRANHRVVPVDLATHSRARAYADRIAQALGVPITLIGTGQGRHQVIDHVGV